MRGLEFEVFASGPDENGPTSILEVMQGQHLSYPNFWEYL